jgi:hypothetical protein
LQRANDFAVQIHRPWEGVDIGFFLNGDDSQSCFSAQYCAQTADGAKPDNGHIEDGMIGC